MASRGETSSENLQIKKFKRGVGYFSTILCKMDVMASNTPFLENFADVYVKPKNIFITISIKSSNKNCLNTK